MIDNETDTCLVIDVLLMLRRIGWKGLTTFNELAFKFCQCVLKVISQNTKRIDFIFYSYLEGSLKAVERSRRYKPNSIIYHNITGNTTLPKQEGKFWGACQNKILLQIFLRDYIQIDINFCGFDLVFSTINVEPCTAVYSNQTEFSLDILQRHDVEEADVKIMIHTNHATIQDYKNIYIISADADVIILALYFWKNFTEHGL